MHRISPTRADGGSLRLWLLSIVMVPIVGVGAASAVEIVTHVSTVRSDQKVTRTIRSSIDLNHLRSALQHELLPALTGAVVANPVLQSSLGLTPTQTATLILTIKQVPQLRKETDAALSIVNTHSEFTTFGAQIGTKIDELRSSIVSKDVKTAFDNAMTILDQLSGEENQQMQAAVRYGLSPATIQAISDLALVTRAVQSAGGEAAYFVSSQFPGVIAAPDVAQANWVQSWSAYQSNSAAVATQTSPEIRTAWVQANALPLAKSTAAVFDTTIAKQKRVVPVLALGVVLTDAQRNSILTQVLNTSAQRVLTAVRAQQQSAGQALTLIAILCLLIIMTSFAAARRFQRALTRPLQRLAFQAGNISQGELTDVAVGGPHEVRTVARGLAALVNSLRIIESQSTAIAVGDLGDLGDLERKIGGSAVPGPLGALVHTSVARIVNTIRERERAQQELAHRASHDALTELPNRAQALLQVESALHRAQRSASMTGLMFVDLDHFKDVNDNFGHAAGDQVLQTIARRMKEIMRSGDTVARLGGDEFVVLLEAVTDEADCFRLAERLVDAASQPIPIGGREVRIGASVGVALCRDGYVDASRLLSEADAAVYKAKNAGRGRIGIFDEGLRTQIAERFELEQAMVSALQNDEFVLYYQPVVDLSTGRVRGVEALIRWQRPGYGLIPPDDFIPTAEGSTLINDIGRWVLREATSQLAAWTALHPALGALTMAVNISGRHLLSPQLPHEVSEVLACSGVPANQLIIEVTETVLVDNVIAKKNMRGLRVLGVQIAIDDFGTGYTSIGQLPLLPVDILKIDRSFVIATAPGNQDLIRLMVAAAHAFNLKVVAEGVENQGQVEALRGANVETGQGYFFARPGPAEQTLKILRASLDSSAAA